MKKLIDTIRGERYDFDNLCKDYRRVLDNSREEGERKRLLEKAADLLDETTVAWNDRVIQKHLFREAWGRAIMATRAAKKGEGGGCW